MPKDTTNRHGDHEPLAAPPECSLAGASLWVTLRLRIE